MKAFRCGGPDGAPSDGDGTTLARAAARFREQQPNSTSMFLAQAQMHPTTNIVPTTKSEFGGGGGTLARAADSREGLYNLCGAGPRAYRRFCKELPSTLTGSICTRRLRWRNSPSLPSRGR